MRASVEELVRAGVFRLAAQPPDNAADFSQCSFYTVPLLAEDYPAKTAAMWNAAYRLFGMPVRNAMMVADPADAPAVFDALRRDPRYRGGGCGVGWKEVALAHLAHIQPLAEAIGAVNIIKKEGRDSLAGMNTDGTGFAESMAERFRARGEELPGKRVMIIGAGGSAKAISFALASEGALIVIANRTKEKAVRLAERINAYFGRRAAESCTYENGVIASILPRQDAVVAAIDDPVSPLDSYSALAAMHLPATSESIQANLETAARRLAKAKPSLIVADIRIRKSETAMLRQARELGFETLDGLPMVVNQGIEAFWFLHGEELQKLGRTKEEAAAVMRDAAYR